MKLRDYQQEILIKALDSYKCGHKSPVLVLPCGAGKTIILSEMTKRANLKNNRVLILAHRIEIIEQIKETIKFWGCDLKLTDVRMVQSAVRRLDKMPNYNFIITDECHHSTASTYTKIYDRYPNAFKIGFTATPARLNGEGLGRIYDDLLIGVSTKWLIENNYLSQFKYYAPKCLIDVKNLHTKRGDYDNKEAAKLLSKNKIYGDVFKEWSKFAYGKKTIAFCSSVEHSIDVCKYFNDNGISAAHIDGKTDKLLRRKIMEKFRTGEILVLCNYEIISEGVDVADCECCLLLRPTQSLTLFIQSSMRCMRPAPNKNAIILDFVGNFKRHGLPDSKHEWSLADKKTIKKTDDEPEVKARQCKNCFKVYPGIVRICPYCGFDNGKTQKQIETEKKAELELIEKYEKKTKKLEERNCTTFESLIELGKKRGYKNPYYWAKMKYKNSWRNK